MVIYARNHHSKHVQTAMNHLQQHRDELAFARQQYQNRDKYFANLSLASIQHDKNIDSSFIDSIGSIVSTVGTGWLFKTLGI